MINARAETLATSSAYRSAFKLRPCLVVADGFYEWQKTKVGKQPYFITTKHGVPFAFAGLWEPKSIAEQDTFTILTCPPNELCAKIHDRMPVILAPGDWPPWLATPDDRKALLRSYPAEQMELWPVAEAVGSARNEGPQLIKPV